MVCVVPYNSTTIQTAKITQLLHPAKPFDTKKSGHWFDGQCPECSYWGRFRNR